MVLNLLLWQRGISAGDLSKVLSCTPGTVVKWVNGTNGIPDPFISKITRHFNLHPRYFDDPESLCEQFQALADARFLPESHPTPPFPPAGHLRLLYYTGVDMLLKLSRKALIRVMTYALEQQVGDDASSAAVHDRREGDDRRDG